MKVVAGLGNPGKRYDNTPHNVGFAVIDRLSRRFGCALRKSLRFKSRVGTVSSGDETLLLVQPQTYMNRSGVAVRGILAYRKIAVEDLIVVFDDADLEFGRIRIRPRGGSGGHKGLASIIEATGQQEFARVRVGIGRPCSGQVMVDHVLEHFRDEELSRFTQVIDRAADAVLCVLESGLEDAMNRFNGPVFDEGLG